MRVFSGCHSTCSLVSRMKRVETFLYSAFVFSKNVCCCRWGILLLCHTVLAVPCSIVVTCSEGLTSWLSCLRCFLVFVTFQYGVLVQVWYLIVRIPDLCILLYFVIIIQALPTTHMAYVTMMAHSSQCVT